MKVNIRDFVHADIKIIKPWLTDKENAQWLDPFFENESLKDEQLAFFLLRRDKRIYIVNCDDIPVGIMGINNIDKINRSAELWSLLGDRAYRRLGITKIAQYLTLKKAFYELDLHSVRAWVVDINVMKTGLEKLNFKTVGRLRECHLLNGVFRDRILFDILRCDFEKIPIDEVFGPQAQK